MTLGSMWVRFLTYFNSALARLGRSMDYIAALSVPSRVWHSAAVQKSLTYRLLFARGTHRLIVSIFALYLPIDWVLRTYAPVRLSFIATLWDEVFLIFGLLYVLFSRMIARPAREHRANPLDMPIIAFIGVGVLLLGIVSPNLSIAVSGYRAVVQYMLWFFILSRVIESDDDVRIFCGVFTAIGVLVSMHGLYQYVIGVPIPSHWVSQAEVGVRTRVFSIFGSPNIMGSFLIMSAPLAASYAYTSKKLWRQILAWAAVGIMALACLLTYSRGAWMGFAVAAAMFAWLKDKRIIALLLFAAGAAVFVMPDVVNRITFLFTDEFAAASQFGGREGRWREGMKLLETANPLFGYGMGRFGGAVAMQNQTNKGIRYFYMDNYYMKTLVEMGYSGLWSYALLVIVTVWTGLRASFRVKGTEMHAPAAALVSAIAGVLVHCFTENIFEVPYMNAYFWGIAALLVYIGWCRKPVKS